ncbi:hypothetical protein PCH_Pc22g26050 [Penicillium rubens Wisconsin 54-1255]|uniref:Uncharacterized protein n=1 Tax=Penicillium rubens (strain ATCC 28089 / DSM 1075 / NRRL 1951 / Wisconsin 54-1255) TaxID=500485 RepID=B6HTD2_PENRW|nr:hypothetical protein PCH_Pc22g26050 [Penicillium rubens Wisconsin 54-1255]
MRNYENVFQAARDSGFDGSRDGRLITGSLPHGFKWRASGPRSSLLDVGRILICYQFDRDSIVQPAEYAIWLSLGRLARVVCHMGNSLVLLAKVSAPGHAGFTPKKTHQVVEFVVIFPGSSARAPRLGMVQGCPGDVANPSCVTFQQHIHNPHCDMPGRSWNAVMFTFARNPLHGFIDWDINSPLQTFG